MWLVQEKADPRHQVSRLEATIDGPHSCQHSPLSLAQHTPHTNTQLSTASAKIESECVLVRECSQPHAAGLMGT
ncbi:hypothetical protein E2C01_005013 [Portunus trituberculatus]|uniref:Uncharacterized protein n=1 Tax=Portunus trituberculatus TaxID=210409 RepID=A0A5B7CR91_PORTR|nr:hypothetical protein [Portunus trituberculatus]